VHGSSDVSVVCGVFWPSMTRRYKWEDLIDRSSVQFVKDSLLEWR
jgi:hypothetical protein